MKKSKRKTIILALLVIALLLSTATFAYWANFVEGTEEASKNQLTIGSADSVDTIFELSNDFNSGGYLVPLNQLDNSSLGSVDKVNLAYDINWIENEDTSMLNGSVVEGELNVTHTVFILTDNGILDHVRYADVYDLIHVEYNSTNPESLILNGDSSTLAFEVTVDEPINQTQYDLIANHTINIAFKFKIADSNIDINNKGEAPSYSPEDETTNTLSQVVLNGDSTIVVELGDEYVDLGATAYDSKGNPIEGTWSEGYADTWELGTYYYQYFAYSSEDNKVLFSETRVIEVVDTTAPEIFINGDETFIVELGTYYSDWGAYALDDSTGAVEVITEGIEDVDINQVGSYVITYTATDESENTSVETRIVEVVESE